MKEGKYAKTLAKILVIAIFLMRDMRRNEDAMLVQPRSQGPLSSSLEEVPWLRLVTCLLDFCRFQEND